MKRAVRGAGLGGRIRMEYVIYLLTVCVVMGVIASFTGKWVTNENPYRSYTLQACAWLEGRLDLGQDYPWLELAIVGEKYYVSFPPFPSFVLLPFAAVFGENTPDHLISMGVTVLGVVYALRLRRLMSGSLEHAERDVLFLYLGNGYLFISMQGWVWYLAQCMGFSLSLMALYWAKKGRMGRAMTFWACAVGCRPMVCVYGPLLLAILFGQWRDGQKERNFGRFLKEKGRGIIPAVCIALVYMALNAARFGNPLEFGHNYLPEFVRAESGQFSLEYLPAHLGQLLRLPKAGGENGALIYDKYDCMAFWLMAPMFIPFFAQWLRALRERRAAHALALPAMLLAHLMILCCHRTLGGFQFGNRYMVDMLPYVFYGLLAFRGQGGQGSLMDMPLCMLGFSVNLIGTVATYNYWI